MKYEGNPWSLLPRAPNANSFIIHTNKKVIIFKTIKIMVLLCLEYPQLLCIICRINTDFLTRCTNFSQISFCAILYQVSFIPAMDDSQLGITSGPLKKCTAWAFPWTD